MYLICNSVHFVTLIGTNRSFLQSQICTIDNSEHFASFKLQLCVSTIKILILKMKTQFQMSYIVVCMKTDNK